MSTTHDHLPDTLARLTAVPQRLADGLRRAFGDLVTALTPADAPVEADPDPSREPEASSGPFAPEPPELTTRELLVAGWRPLDETGDADRAERARRIADSYLERRQRKLREALDEHR